MKIPKTVPLHMCFQIHIYIKISSSHWPVRRKGWEILKIFNQNYPVGDKLHRRHSDCTKQTRSLGKAHSIFFVDSWQLSNPLNITWCTSLAIYRRIAYISHVLVQRTTMKKWVNGFCFWIELETTNRRRFCALYSLIWQVLTISNSKSFTWIN